ncbi:RpiB/LacA/LacB family sugar-phosphate isomerase [Candidatus Pacearchaeota archaeon]|nr:RpiB/LacA/LacB family sugar-phosphate isomerase [Candidatus Pacearchaeota archaeon]MBD3282738.1 RpiB/LacA/LacB family sugar-phosphate isomerase [Candidatus Pacearchaeota archaeon]
MVFGCNPRRFRYKEDILNFLKIRSYKVVDVGCYSGKRCDYPLISEKIAKKIKEDIFNRVGIGVYGSGIGISIPASKYIGIYCARCLKPEDAKTSRKHNNTHFLGISADNLSSEEIFEIVDSWMNTPFYTEGEDKAYLRRYIKTVNIDCISK